MDKKEEIELISGVNVLKCMRCGKCSGTCPSYDEMEYHPHQFVYMVETGNIDCVERCPRGVEPAKVIEAVRLSAIRQKGANHLKAEQVPELIDDDVPQQLLVSAFRKYSK